MAPGFSYRAVYRPDVQLLDREISKKRTGQEYATYVYNSKHIFNFLQPN